MGGFSFIIAILAAIGLSLTLLEIFELIGGSSERGGTFDLVAETMGGIASILTGWSLLAAETLLVAALILPAWQLVQAGFNLLLPNWLGGLLLLSVLSITQLFPFDRRRRFRNLLASLMILGLAAIMIGAVLSPGWRFPEMTGSLSATDLWRGAARLGFMYLMLESGLVARRQMRRERVSIIGSMLWVMAAGSVLVGLGYLAVAGLWPEGSTLSIWQNLLARNSLPEPLVASVILLTLLLSARAVLTLSARNIYDMSRLGSLPAALRSARRPFSAPPLLVLAPALPITCWFLLYEYIPFLEVAAGLFLTVALLVNIAGNYRRRAEPERRRTLSLPIFPLFPAIAITVLLSFILNLGGRAQVFSLGWLLLGILVYFLYAQRRQVAAQKGLTLFVGDQRLEKEAGTYRILVPLAAGEHRHFILQLAVGLAKQPNGDVLPLQVIPVPDPLVMEEAHRLAQERNTLFHWSTRLASQAGVAIHPIIRLARTVPEGILDTAVAKHTDLLLIPWAMAEDPEEGQMGAVLDPVIAQAPCDTAVVAYRPNTRNDGADPESAIEASSQTIKSILVPTAGGPHAPLAVGLGMLLAREFGAKVTSVYVTESSASETEIKAGEDRIRANLEAMEERAAEALHRDPEFSLLDGT
ncbi:MAG: universal stress protein [Anaerolineales bacterium]